MNEDAYENTGSPVAMDETPEYVFLTAVQIDMFTEEEAKILLLRWSRACPRSFREALDSINDPV